ncbi:Piso0_004150 [Millerozyma farinosa CBS 7064]|uniref:Nuclear pore complex protein Nup85 n=1 Tax=Pichia sorbitophila (strain ATCC MYA-4447 / BCRC 22081 / CBS 7064 / NBRC 10061 / NRRL Y-12695) TaxID=559304 RepID=G8YAI7_PICSO|nr:Piso0_004150 [Millerozyma farinosa CBS 7064]CCE84601.1 Piso0_004150 [Millerozyma farinosa CBS 7064]
MSSETISNKGYDDIEMLEVDDETHGSETDSISNDLSSPKQKTEDNQLKLQDWLDSDQHLKFSFSVEKYKESIKSDQWSSVHRNYVNSLFKIIEKVTQDEGFDQSHDDFEEPIGVVTRDKSSAMGNKGSAFDRKLDETLTSIIEHLIDFIKETESVEGHEENTEQFHYLLNVLDCLKANNFYSDISSRPNLISKWVNRFDAKPDPSFVEDVMISTPKPYLHPQFWNTYLAQLITRGLLPQATSAIASSGFTELESTEPELYNIIQDFSIILENYSSLALKGKFSEWKLTCCEFRDFLPSLASKISSPQHNIIANQIRDLMCILTGFQKTISAFCDSWYEVYLALALYQVYDDESLYEEYFKDAVNEKPILYLDDPEDPLTSSENAFVNIFEARYLKVLTFINSFDGATAAFISRLMESKGLFDTYYKVSNSGNFDHITNRRTVSEYLLTKFSYECLESHDLIPVGIGILSNQKICCSRDAASHNRSVISEVITNYECQTNEDLEWALTVCASLNLTSTANILYRKFGNRSLEDGYIFEALTMLVKSFDPNHIEPNESMKDVHRIVWDLIFQDSLLNNRPIQDELINNIVLHDTDRDFQIHPVVRQCLSPYAVLLEFFEAVKSKKVLNAMDVLTKLVHLMRHVYLPKKFYPLLLCQFIPFLHGNYKFELPDLIIIIELIDNFEKQTDKPDYDLAEKLYEYSINNMDELQSYDWRRYFKENNVALPKSLGDLIRFLRDSITARVARVYIEGDS